MKEIGRSELEIISEDPQQTPSHPRLLLFSNIHQRRECRPARTCHVTATWWYVGMLADLLPHIFDYICTHTYNSTGGGRRFCRSHDSVCITAHWLLHRAGQMLFWWVVSRSCKFVAALRRLYKLWRVWTELFVLSHVHMDKGIFINGVFPAYVI